MTPRWFFRVLKNAEGDAESFIAGEVGVDLILESKISIHLAGVKGGEQTALGVTFKAVTQRAENRGGRALVKGGCGWGCGWLLGRKRQDESEKQERNDGETASDHVAIS